MTAVQAVQRGLVARLRPASDGRLLALATPLLVLCTAAGLFTLSWDRLANVALAGYNVKLPAVLFSVAAVAAVPTLWQRRVMLRQPVLRIAAVLCCLILLVLGCSTTFAANPAAGVGQMVSVTSGAMAPAVAVIALVRRREDLVWVLRWLIAGAYLASVFGLYQLLAHYTGLPQFVEYGGLGTDGVLGRISSFSYEPAYFANFLVLALGAAAASSLLRGRPLGWAPIVLFSLVLVLANVRSLIFLLPVFAVLLAMRWRQNRGAIVRLAAALVVIAALNAGVTAGVQGLLAHSATTSAARAPALGAERGREAPAQRADSPTNVLNPNEQSSNAPRLALYKAVLRTTAEHPVLGVGPGNLRGALAAVGYVAPNQGAQVVANNVWLQALADGGPALVAAELGVVLLMSVLLFRRRLSTVEPVAAAWLSVILVSGMLTSYFFDMKLWIGMAILLSAAAVLGASRTVDSSAPAAIEAVPPV